MNDKIASLLGFAVKANKLIYGYDALSEGHKKRYLIICCHTLAERSLQSVKELAVENKVPLLITKTRKLEDIIFKKNCKVVGLSDKQMSEAIIKYLTEDYSFIRSEEI